MYIYRRSWLITELTISLLIVNELPTPWPNLKIQTNLSQQVRWDEIFSRSFHQKKFAKIFKVKFLFPVQMWCKFEWVSAKLETKSKKIKNTRNLNLRCNIYKNVKCKIKLFLCCFYCRQDRISFRKNFTLRNFIPYDYY